LIYLVESFRSFQGEGKYAGTPSVFVRFGGCNLRCEGFGVRTETPSGNVVLGCDSARAVYKKEFGSSWRKIESEKELIEEINLHIKKNCKPDIVFTGGEPLIYHKEKAFYKTIEHFLSLSYRITVETNGTVFVDFEKYPLFKRLVFAVSVKLSNSKEPYEKRVDFKALDSIFYNAKDSFFKFVLDKNIILSGKAEKEIENIIMKYNNCEVYCMPLGSTSSELQRNDKYVAEFCVERCFHYMDRLHIRLWNNSEKR